MIDTGPHRVRPGDPHLDFVLRPYAPPSSPTPTSLRSRALLSATWATSPVADRLEACFESVRVTVGDLQTVWAAKVCGGVMSWEVYVYDLEGRGAPGPIDLLDALDRWLEVDRSWCDAAPVRPDVYSFDIAEAHLSGEQVVDHVNVYVPNATSTVPGGFSYRIDGAGPRLQNAYARFGHDQLAATARSLRGSLHVPSLEAALWPDLLPCDSLHVARKPEADGLYYAGIDVVQLGGFLRPVALPDTLAALVTDRGSDLAHLRFDVGVDIASGRVERPRKAALYGVL